MNFTRTQSCSISVVLGVVSFHRTVLWKHIGAVSGSSDQAFPFIQRQKSTVTVFDDINSGMALRRHRVMMWHSYNTRGIYACE